MGRSQEATWYDDHADAVDHADITQNPWYPVWDLVHRWLPTSAPVIDLGCGSGGLARVFRDRSRSGLYYGIDFSQRAIQMAEDLVGVDEQYTFDHGDIREHMPQPQHSSTVYVCTEVLEHIDDDWSVLRLLPPGYRFVFSVPNYDSEAHARYFLQPREAFNRYADTLTFTGWRLLDMGPPDGKAIHVFDSNRRWDTL